jgi:hypothetical protein
MAYSKPTNPTWWMMPHANYVLNEREISTFQKPICIPKNTIRLLHIIGKTFVNRDVV